jgi:hypothetical protein
VLGGENLSVRRHGIAAVEALGQRLLIQGIVDGLAQPLVGQRPVDGVEA